MISVIELPKQRASVHGQAMAYVESGAGDPIVFLHGNPTSSYLWRNVMPHLAGLGRCLAPDLIGMGDSEKLDGSGPDSYRFVEHRRYLDGLLDALQVAKKVTIVGHDWGSALGFDWANRHREAVKGIAYMEAIVRPLAWADWPEPIRKLFQGFRSPAGEAMILEKNVFVERVLPGSVLRGLTEAEIAVYRPAVCRARRGAPPDPHLAARDPARRRARGRRGDRPELCRMAREERRPEALRQRRARRDPDRRATGVLPELAQPDRGHGQRQPLRPGGLARRDRPGACRLVPRPRVTLPRFNSADRRPLSRTRRTAAAPSCRQRATPGSRRRRRSRPQGRSRRRCWRGPPRRGCRGCARSAPARC